MSLLYLITVRESVSSIYVVIVMVSRPHIVDELKERCLNNLGLKSNLCKHISLLLHRQGLQTLNHWFQKSFVCVFSPKFEGHMEFDNILSGSLLHPAVTVSTKHKERPFLGPLTLNLSALSSLLPLSFASFFLYFAGLEKPKPCPGLGLFYAFLSTVLFSIIALLVKTIQGVHAIEISAIRCFFQMIFTAPLLIYHK